MARRLVASEQDFAQAWFAIGDERATGVFPTTEDSIRHIGQTLGQTWSAASVAAAAQLRAAFMQLVLVPRPEAMGVLTEIRARGFSTGLISDCTADVPEAWLATPFSALIDAPVFSCTAGVKKPHPRIYELVCTRLGAQPEDCWYVGDGGSGELTGAAAMGMSAVLLRAPEEVGEGIYRAGTDDWHGPTVPTLDEVLSWLEA